MKGLIFGICMVISGACLTQEKNNSELDPTSNRAELEIQVLMYPNPSHGNLFMEGKNGTTISIYSLKGTYLGKWIIEKDQKVEITDLPEGTFICEINFEEQRITKRIVVL